MQSVNNTEHDQTKMMDHRESSSESLQKGNETSNHIANDSNNHSKVSPSEPVENIQVKYFSN